MNFFFTFLKKIFSYQKKDDFFYLKEEISHQNESQNHKIAYLTSYKKVG